MDKGREPEIGGRAVLQPAHRFPVLDLLRGVAALVVVCFHNEVIFGGRLFRHGYLAVDFFFMLSGFVLTLAYQDRLDAGWSTWRFMRVRLIRLFPLYLFALVVSAVYLKTMARQSFAWHALGLPLLLAVVMLPATPWTRNGLAYPYNMPSWSLVLELVANLFHGTWLRKRSLWFLVATAGVAAIAMAYVVRRFATVDVGVHMGELIWALPRTLFSYVVGMILFRLWQRGALKFRVPAVALVLALLVALVGMRLQRADVFYDAAVILLVFPAILFAGAGAVSSLRLRGVAELLGRSSYAVYVIHVPLKLWWPVLLSYLGIERLEQHVPLDGYVFLLVAFGVAVLLDRFYDGPVRGFFQRRR